MEKNVGGMVERRIRGNKGQREVLFLQLLSMSCIDSLISVLVPLTWECCSSKYHSLTENPMQQ